MDGEDDPLGSVQKIEIWAYCQIVHKQTNPSKRMRFSGIFKYKLKTGFRPENLT